MFRCSSFLVLFFLVMGCVAQTPVTRVQALENQAQQGDALAQLRLGELYLTGQGSRAE